MKADPQVFEPVFAKRFRERRSSIRDALLPLYGDRADFEAVLNDLVQVSYQAFLDRGIELQAHDRMREQESDWFLDPEGVAYSAYVDRFAGSLSAIADKIPYLRRLGVRYLHLLPFLQMRPHRNDGGFAVSSFRDVAPALGHITDLLPLSRELRHAGIALCADLLCNHTSDDHEWALRAKAGDVAYRDYYLTFASKAQIDAFEAHLPQIFAATAPGNFTFCEAFDRYVWTTFYPYQWDLNYANPAVFREILSASLFLANQGVEIFRLDSVPFLWKRLGTNCQNQPEVHYIVAALRALISLAAPGVVLKAEAIVPADQLAQYFGNGALQGQGCHLAYNTTLMTYQWHALARGDARALAAAMNSLPSPPAHAGWMNYVRCHDDIGWSVLADPADRETLSRFYSGEAVHSFARGQAFQTTSDQIAHGTSGSLASLCGLEAALSAKDPLQIELALARIRLMMSVSLSYGGIPLIYMGDELGQLNDHRFEQGPRYDGDGRWLHRGAMDWQPVNDLDKPYSLQGRLFGALQQLIVRRAGLGCLRRPPDEVGTGPDAVLRFFYRDGPASSTFLAMSNFSGEPVTCDLPTGQWRDLLVSNLVLSEHAVLAPYQARWLVPNE